MRTRKPTSPDDENGTTCPGTTIAFNRRAQFARGEHDRRLYDAHGKPTGDLARSWGVCWKCKRPLGCTICTTSSETEILCRPCGAWGTKAAFEHHGPMMPGARLRHVAELAEYLAHWPRVATSTAAAVVEERAWAS